MPAPRVNTPPVRSFVDSFDGMSGADWADQTAIQANLGVNDLLLAIAVKDRLWGLSLDNDSDVSELTQGSMESNIGIWLPTSWVQPVVSSASNLRSFEHLSGATARPSPTPTAPEATGTPGEAASPAEAAETPQAGQGPNRGGTPTPSATGAPSASASPKPREAFTWANMNTTGRVTITVLVVLILGGIARFLNKYIWPIFKPIVDEVKKKQAASAAAEAAEAAAKASLEELSRQAGTALVNLDNGLRASEAELGFARAEFGLQATDQFREALDLAKQDAAAAFAVSQQLEDSTPETEAQQRESYAQILHLCDQASGILAEQNQAFAELRQLADRADEILNDTEQRADEAEQRVPLARDILEALGATYPPETLASATGLPDQALALISQARQNIATGQQAWAAGDKSQAASYARLAQGVVAQAGQLLDSVDGVREQLLRAREQIKQQLASLTADLDDAERLAAQDEAVVAAASQAKAAMEQARSAAAGSDPLAAVAQLMAVEAALDQALVPARGEAAAAVKAAQTALVTLTQVGQIVDQAQLYIGAQSAFIGTIARTRLSEADRVARYAQSLVQADPARAEASAQQAMDLAQQAYQLAQSGGKPHGG